MAEAKSPQQKNIQDNEIDPKKMNKHLLQLAWAVEKTYGSTWLIIWRNFLAGISRALGATFGYIIFIGVAVLIAQKLGVFASLQKAWNNFLNKLPFEQKSAYELQADPELQRIYEGQQKARN